VKPSTQAGIDIGILNDETEELEVYSDTADNRSWVTIQLKEEGYELLNKTPGGINYLVVSDIGDYASLQDGERNLSDTQYITFESPTPPRAPEVETIVRQSPEQYKITFSQSLREPLTTDNIIFEYLQNGSYPLNGELPVTLDDEETKSVRLSQLSAKVYLLELNADWTVIRNTPVSGISYYNALNNRVRITVQSIPNVAPIVNKFGTPLADTPSRKPEFTLTMDAGAGASPYVDKIEYTAVSDEHANGLVTINMNEPVQINVNDSAHPEFSTIPLSPNITQLNTGKLYGTLDYDATQYTYITSGDKRSAIDPPRFYFVKLDADGNPTGTTILGNPKAVDEEDKVITVEPERPLTETGRWRMTYEAISDDHGNTNASDSVDFDVLSEEQPSTSPYVVWATVYDNIYVDKGGRAELNDVVYIQYSEPMDVSTFLPYGYYVNDYPINVGSAGANINNESPSLVRITLPYNFLYDPVNGSDPRAVNSNPFRPKENHTITVPASAKDLDGNTLTGPTLLGATYTHNDDLTIIEPHVPALVNANSWSTALGSRIDIAYLENAVTYAYRIFDQSLNRDVYVSTVKTIEPILPFYDASGWQTGAPSLGEYYRYQVYQDAPLHFYSPSRSFGRINLEAPNTTAVVVDAEVGGAGVYINAQNAAEITLTAPVGGDVEIHNRISTATVTSIITIDEVGGNVTIDAKAADVTVNGDVNGDITITSDLGKNIWIHGDVPNGTLTINAPKATVHLLPGADRTNVTADEIVLIDVNQTTLVVGKDFTISKLIIDARLDHKFIIKYSGEISAMEIQGLGDEIEVWIQSNDTPAQIAAAQKKFDDLVANTTKPSSRILKLATKSSL
jgi:hypothetical protein